MHVRRVAESPLKLTHPSVRPPFVHSLYQLSIIWQTHLQRLLRPVSAGPPNTARARVDPHPQGPESRVRDADTSILKLDHGMTTEPRAAFRGLLKAHRGRPALGWSREVAQGESG